MAVYRLASALKLHENEIMKQVAEKKCDIFLSDIFHFKILPYVSDYDNIA